MRSKFNYITSVIFALIGIVILIRYEIKEYLRFSTSAHWYLKLYLQYGLALLLICIAAIKGFKIYKNRKSPIGSIPLLTIVVGLLAVLGINFLTTEIDYDLIVLKDGLYCDSTSGKPLSGTYKSSSRWDGFGGDLNCVKMSYKNGIPIGKWMDSHKGQLIHQGIYLEESNFKTKVRLLTKSQRIDLDLWDEGEHFDKFPFLTVSLIEPMICDSLIINEISNQIKLYLSDTYKVEEIFIEKLINGKKTELKRVKLK